MNLLAGFVDPLKLTLFPHAAFSGVDRGRSEVRKHLDLEDFHPIIATYGFFLPGKGLDTALDVHEQILKRNPNALLLMVNAEYPNKVSRAEIERVESIVCDRGLENSVIMITQYLSNEDSLILLQSADVVILPYAPSKESASGSVRRAMAAGRPVVVSDQSIFVDLTGIVETADATRPDEFAAEVIRILGDPRRHARIVSRQENWMEAHSSQKLAQRLFGMVAGLTVDTELAKEALANGGVTLKPAEPSAPLARKPRSESTRKRPRGSPTRAAE
jgi:glycosyltransferase involved in cell wall biosynthesis